jgi:hypothetical protein
MMQHVSGIRALALIAGLVFAATGTALAQDTTEAGGAPMDTTALDTGVTDTSAVDTSAVRDTTDTSGVENPPGYRGMERDTTIFPDSGNPSASADEVEDQTTGTYDDSTTQDTAGGMEPAAGDTAGANDSTSVGDTEPTVEDSAAARMHPSESAGDTASQAPDSTP